MLSFRYLPQALVVFILFTSLTGAARAEDTPLRVLVRSNDAKFIGTGVGGLQAIVSNADTGELLGSGPIEGGTGDTAGLMEDPQTRGDTLVTDDSASLDLVLELDRPTRIAVSVTGPGAAPQSRQLVKTTLWLLPGQDRATHPLVLHLDGLLVDLVDLEMADGVLAITAKVSMLCGCTITEDGLWRADDYRVSVTLYRDGERIAEQPLAFTGESSRYAGVVTVPAAGDLQLELQALQRSTGNAGVYRQVLRR